MCYCGRVLQNGLTIKCDIDGIQPPSLNLVSSLRCCASILAIFPHRLPRLAPQRHPCVLFLWPWLLLLLLLLLLLDWPVVRSTAISAVRVGRDWDLSSTTSRALLVLRLSLRSRLRLAVRLHFSFECLGHLVPRSDCPSYVCGRVVELLYDLKLMSRLWKDRANMIEPIPRKWPTLNTWSKFNNGEQNSFRSCLLSLVLESLLSICVSHLLFTFAGAFFTRPLSSSSGHLLQIPPK